jgi:hypothetical protein
MYRECGVHNLTLALSSLCAVSFTCAQALQHLIPTQFSETILSKFILQSSKPCLGYPHLIVKRNPSKAAVGIDFNHSYTRVQNWDQMKFAHQYAEEGSFFDTWGAFCLQLEDTLPLFLLFTRSCQQVNKLLILPRFFFQVVLSCL